MPMGEDFEDLFHDSWEQKLQLYMMEVLIDKVKVFEDQAFAPQNPILPTLVKIQFADFPVLTFDNNELLIAENLDNEDSSCVTIHEKVIKGVPDNWIVKKSGPSYYSVEIPLISRSSIWNIQENDTVKLLVPKIAVTSGEGLKYIFATLKSRGDEEVLNLVTNQISQELQRIKDTGESKVVTEHKFSSGKSCLFHMTPKELISSFQETPLKIQVYRSCLEGDNLIHTLIGEAKIPLGLSFIKAVLLANTPVLLPVAAHVEDVFPMIDVFGNQSGSICLFVRMSCFGTPTFQDEEDDDDAKKQKLLKHFLKGGQITCPKGELDLQYPWKKNLNAVKDRPAPRPRLQPMYDPLPPPPPPPLPPFEMGDFFPELPRCSPLSPPPCYRRAGDPPLSRCNQAMEAQLRREDLTKGAQTDQPSPKNYYNQYNYDNLYSTQGLLGGYQDNNKKPVEGSCTCPTIPPELRPQEEVKQKVECTCTAVIKTLGPTNIPASGGKEDTKSVGLRQPISKPPVLGDSDYEITLTKSKCGLEDQKEVKYGNDMPNDQIKVPETIPPGVINNSNSLRNKTENNEVMPEKVKNILKEEISKTKEITEKTQKDPPEITLEPQQSKKNVEPKAAEESASLDQYQMEDFEFKKDKKVKKTRIYEQTAGMYPGRHVGHKHCLIPQRRVPKTMGWLWTSVTFNGMLKPGRGWRPGSIRKDVNNMLNTVRTEDSDPDVKIGTQPKLKYRPFSAKSQQTKKPVETVKHNPTLHIHKKEGYIYVSLIPAKVDSEDDTGEEPKPIQFKIDPKHPDGVEDGESCYDSSETSSDVKSYEMDFTAPIALKKRKRIVEKSVMGTQYNEMDFTKKIQKKQKNEPEPPPKEPVEDHKKKKTSGKGKGKKK